MNLQNALLCIDCDEIFQAPALDRGRCPVCGSKTIEPVAHFLPPIRPVLPQQFRQAAAADMDQVARKLDGLATILTYRRNQQCS